MENNTAIVISVAGMLVSLAGVMVQVFKARSEVKKINAEGQSSIADGAESVALGAKVSSDLLLQRINEMEERDKLRKQEIEAIRKELSDVRLEMVEWKDYAIRLVYQVKSLGHEPIPFKPVPASKAASE